MLKFFIYFIAVQAFLFSSEQIRYIQESFIIPFTEAVTRLSAALIQCFDARVVSQGNIIQHLDNGFAVAVKPGCNGVEALIVLFSAIIVFPAPWKHKLYGIGVSFLAVQSLNLIRIITLFYLGQWDYKIFEWAHLYIWEALIMLDVLVLFLIWVRLSPAPARA